MKRQRKTWKENLGKIKIVEKQKGFYEKDSNGICNEKSQHMIRDQKSVINRLNRQINPA